MPTSKIYCRSVFFNAVVHHTATRELKKFYRGTHSLLAFPGPSPLLTESVVGDQVLTGICECPLGEESEIG